MESNISVYLIAGIIGGAAALLLGYFAHIQSQGNAGMGRKTKGKDDFISPYPKNQSLENTIYEEIGNVVGSKELSQEISAKVSDIFNKELEKKITFTTDELDKKYNSIIEEKKHNEEIAINKYKKTLVEKKDTEAVIKSIAEGLVVVNAEGKVVMMNPAAEKLLDAPKKDKIGKNILEDLKEEEIISFVKDSSADERKEIEVISKNDETKKILQASSAVIEDENGKTIGMVSMLSDITKQKELDRMKANFIASVSHELRTPLVAMDKSIALLLSKTAGPVSEIQEQFLSIASRNLKRLSRLIDDLLDLSKMEARKMKVEYQQTSIDKIIDEVMATFNTWAETKSIKLEKRIDNNMPAINLDQARMIQVFNNLISNAIKFTPKGGKIGIEAHFLKNMQQIKVSVDDSGIGIPKDDLEKIFDKFYQTGERETADINGTGLGLSIVKEIIELHGGKIWVESEKGQGAKFIFTLPLINK